MTAARRLCGEIVAYASFSQLREFRGSEPPLPPDRRPKPTSGPPLKTLQHRRGFAFPEVTDPASKVSGQRLGHSFHADTLAPLRKFPDPLLESQHRLWRNSPPRFPTRSKAEAQKLPFPRPCHRTLLLVHLEFKRGRDESPNAFH